jgi:ferrous iron transport protein B
VEQSYLGRAARWVQPLFQPAGFDWKITVGALASFPAREVFVSTMGVLYGGAAEVEETDLRARLAAARREDGRPVFTLPVVVAILIFFALCLQCGSTVAVIARTASWRWAAFAFGYMTLLAWLRAVGAYPLEPNTPDNSLRNICVAWPLFIR